MSDDTDEPTIPRAALNKLIKDHAPHIRVANETRDLLHACCLEFVKFVGAEANRICAQEQRKTISHEHAYKALDTLGFGAAYQEAALSVLDECKEAAQKRLMRQNSRLDKCGIPEDELLKRQQELFEKARAEQAEVDQANLNWFQKQYEMQQEKREFAPFSIAVGGVQQQQLVKSEEDGRQAADATDSTSEEAEVGVNQTSVIVAGSQSTLDHLQLDEDYDAPE